MPYKNPRHLKPANDFVVWLKAVIPSTKMGQFTPQKTVFGGLTWIWSWDTRESPFSEVYPSLPREVWKTFKMWSFPWSLESFLEVSPFETALWKGGRESLGSGDLKILHRRPASNESLLFFHMQFSTRPKYPSLLPDAIDKLLRVASCPPKWTTILLPQDDSKKNNTSKKV